MTAGTQRDPARDGGFVAVEWSMAVAVLLLPILGLVAVLPGWASTRAAANAAAREGARAAALQPNAAAAAESARAAATGVLGDRRIPAQRAAIDVLLPPGDPLPRDGAVQVTVAVQLPAANIPMLGGLGPTTVTATHRRSLDPLRSR